MVHNSKIPFESNFNLNYKIKDEETAKTEYQEKLKKLKTGTTTVGLVCKDGVCLATDNRATMGYFVASKTAEKLHMIQPYLWMTIAGGVADAQYLIDHLRAETNIYNLKNDTKISVKAAATLLSRILYEKKGQYGVGLILGGCTPEEPGAIYDLGGYGSILKENFCSVGSGSPFAIGVMEANYNDEITVEKGMDLAAAAVRSAIIRDIASGNGIDVVGITKDGYKTKSYTIKEDPLKTIKL